MTIHSGLQAGFDRVPVGLRGLLPEGSTGGTIELQRVLAAVPAPQLEPPTLSVLVRSGEAELGVVLTPVKPPSGQAGLLVGSAGGFELRVVSAIIDEPDDRAERIEELEQIIGYLGFVNEVEAWVGAPLYPPSSPTDADAKVLAELIGRIRNPKAEGTWDRLELTMTNRPEHEVFVLAVVRPIYAPIFGETRYVGGELLAIPEARLDPDSADAKVGDTIAVRPGKDDSVSVVFERPADAPEDALRLR